MGMLGYGNVEKMSFLQEELRNIYYRNIKI
jgi:hypothetical protein